MGKISKTRDTKRKQFNLPSCTEHQIWIGIWNRCYDPQSKAFERYGARGIRVSERWRDFFAFVEDMGRRPSADHSVDRKDNDGDYTPDNCRWATAIEQTLNKRNSIRITIEGVTQTHTAWCRQLGVGRETSLRRFQECGDWEKAFELSLVNREEARKIKITIDGETRGLQGWCKKYGIPAKVIWQRITRDGMSPEEAVTRSLDNYADHKNAIRITLNGVTRALNTWCKLCGIPRTTAKRRYKRLQDWSKVFPMAREVAN